MLNVRPLDKYESVKTVLVTLCFSHKKTLSFQLDYSNHQRNMGDKQTGPLET